MSRLAQWYSRRRFVVVSSWLLLVVSLRENQEASGSGNRSNQ
jgi:hypothetical protein